MKPATNTLTLGAVILALAGCTQTLLLTPVSGNTASATVQSPPLHLGAAHLSVVLDGKTYVGIAGDSHRETRDEVRQRFGWTPDHRHPGIKREMIFLRGATTLTATDDTTLDCEHLRHGDDWRLRCKRAGGEVVQLQRAKP